MRLKVSKEQAIDMIHAVALNTVKQSFYVENIYYQNESHVDINTVIARAIANGIQAGFKAYIDLQYTDEDFENDLGLNRS